jgi:hypothetical protein
MGSHSSMILPDSRHQLTHSFTEGGNEVLTVLQCHLSSRPVGICDTHAQDDCVNVSKTFADCVLDFAAEVRAARDGL